MKRRFERFYSKRQKRKYNFKLSVQIKYSAYEYEKIWGPCLRDYTPTTRYKSRGLWKDFNRNEIPLFVKISICPNKYVYKIAKWLCVKLGAELVLKLFFYFWEKIFWIYTMYSVRTKKKHAKKRLNKVVK